MRLLGRRQELPYHMFELAKEAYDARKADKMSSVYHRGQERAWSGGAVLDALVEEHGIPQLSVEQAAAIRRVFGVILWGELAAWKIAAQLSDELVPVEAKLAATSQAHDEARHFYTLYDYLAFHGPVPTQIGRASERVLELSLGAPGLAHKVCGMQLMIETIALTLFRTVRESGVEPVLCNLLRYYEIDESRHVALGVNFMPFLIRDLGPIRRWDLLAFQGRLMLAVIWSLRSISDDLRVLGVDPRLMLRRGKAKQFEVFREMWSDLGIDIVAERQPLDRVFDATEQLLFPEDPESPLLDRARRAWDAVRSDKTEVDQGYVDETREEVGNTANAPVLPGMGEPGAKFWERRKRARAKRAKKAATLS